MIFKFHPVIIFQEPGYSIQRNGTGGTLVFYLAKKSFQRGGAQLDTRFLKNPVGKFTEFKISPFLAGWPLQFFFDRIPAY
jgi:hypothetical protein